MLNDLSKWHILTSNATWNIVDVHYNTVCLKAATVNFLIPHTYILSIISISVHLSSSGSLCL